MTFYRETPCEHGGMSPHIFEFYTQDRGLETALAECPGGSREVVTIDWEAATQANRGRPDYTRDIVNAALGITEDE